MKTQNFDEYMKKNEPAAVKRAREAYEAAVQKLHGAGEDHPDFQKLRDAKRAAAIAHSNARQAAEAEFFAEEVATVKETVVAYKADQAKKPGAPTLA